MYSPVIKVAATIATPTLGKQSALTFVRNADGSNPLYAGYLLGTDFHAGLPSEGAPLTDLSGNGRNLVQVGNNVAGTQGVQAKEFIGNIANYLTTPFTGDALAAAGTPNEFEIFAVGKFPTTSSSRIAINSAAGNARHFAFDATVSWDVAATQFDDVAGYSGGMLALITGSPAPRDSGYVILSAGYSVTQTAAFRSIAGAVAEATTTVGNTGSGVRTLGGPAISIFTKTVTTLDTRGVLWLAYNRRLTSGERLALKAGSQAILANFAVAAG